MIIKISLRWIIAASLLTVTLPVVSQSDWMIGVGFLADHFERPGIWAEFEWTRTESHELQSLLALGGTYSSDSDYAAAGLLVQAGSRWRFARSLFLESSLGLGGTAVWYRVDGIFYQDKWGNITRHGKGPNIGLMPLADLGLTYKPPATDRLFLRVKLRAYWNLDLQSLETPAWALVFGVARISSNDRGNI